MQPLGIGDRTLAMWPREQEWFYPGVVCGVGAGQLDIQFDDGGRDTVPIAESRPVQLVSGMRVYGNWGGAGAYYPGRIAAVQGAALFLEYDDGDKEVTSISLVRVHRSDLP